MYRDDEYCQLRARIQELEDENKILQAKVAAKLSSIDVIKALHDIFMHGGKTTNSTGPR